MNPDALAEFRVETDNYSAEYGRSSGAVINASIKSGTNQFHGEIWEFLRNTDLNAGGFFRAASGEKPAFNQNQFGGALGEVQSSKKKRSSLPITRASAVFPTHHSSPQFRRRAMRAGNLGVPVTNPLTGKVYADGVIPTSDMTPFSRAVLRRSRSQRCAIRRTIQQLRVGARHPDEQ